MRAKKFTLICRDAAYFIKNKKSYLENIYLKEASCLHYSHDSMGSLERAIKRMTDVVCALFGLVILSPLFLVIAVLLRFQHDGRVFFGVKTDSECLRGKFRCLVSDEAKYKPIFDTILSTMALK